MENVFECSQQPLLRKHSDRFISYIITPATWKFSVCYLVIYRWSNSKNFAFRIFIGKIVSVSQVCQDSNSWYLYIHIFWLWHFPSSQKSHIPLYPKGSDEKGRRNVTKMVWQPSPHTTANFCLYTQKPRAFLSLPQHAPRLTLMVSILSGFLYTNLPDNGHFLWVGLFLRVWPPVCCACRHRSPPESRANVWGGWAQESHVVKNVAGLRPWQDLLHKYRMKQK